MSSPPRQLRDPAHRVSPRARWMWFTTEMVSVLLLTAALCVAAYFWDWLGDRWWIVVVVVVLDLASAVVVPQWRYRVHRWEVTDTAVYTQTGWWSRERRIAPMSRIQTVEYQQGPIARLFRLASVTITTASAAGSLEVVGLDREQAAALADELTVKADLDEGDAT